ncbi:MAG: nucleoside deaminase [Wenzhouxiangella sp.]
MTFNDSLRIDMPSWLRGFAGQLPQRLETPELRMAVAVSLSRENLRHGSGGPFGAVVVDRQDGRWLSLGVNRVASSHCSCAHAEIMALSLAQQRLADWDLGRVASGDLELVSSCEPCAMCLGAIPWSGVRSLVCGATKEDAEAAGFDEGDRPDAWVDKLEARGISVTLGVARHEAAAVLARYARSGQPIYNPG